jgi:hypothetical protein
MYDVLGWLNVGFIATMTAPYWLREINKRTLNLKGGYYAKLIKVLRGIHKPLGLLVILIAPVHGYLALGGLRLHTGSLVFAFVSLTGILGLSFYLTKKKSLFKWHKVFALTIFVFLGIHLLFPSALYTLFKI